MGIFRCKLCDFTLEFKLVTEEVTTAIFGHERTHPENKIKDDVIEEITKECQTCKRPL